MLLYIKTLVGKELKLNVELDTTIAIVKQKVEELEGIPPSQQRLVFNGRQLSDEKNLEEYNVIAGSYFHLVLAL
jgi:ubiquitin